jgi:hypothetical protein
MGNAVQRRVDDIVAELDFNARHHWLGLGDVSRIKTGAPLDEDTSRPVFERVLAKMQDPAYLAWTCQTLFGFQPHPFQGVALQELWKRAFPMLVWTRGGSKTTVLGIYAILRALLDQGSKVLLVSAAFRQAKGIFDVCAKRWYDSPMLRSLVAGGNKQGPRFEVDRCSMALGDSTITAIPLGNGEKVRGMRATHLLIDEFKSVPIDVVENVVVGFAAVAADPMEKVKRAAYLEYLKAHGAYHPEMEADGGKLASNQTVISGTAYYGFNHYSTYFKKWKSYIEVRNDPERYRRLIGREMGPDFDSGDYMVMRIPAEMLPAGFMDSKTLDRLRSSITAANYLMEVGACFCDDSDGFFRRALVEGCVVGRPGHPISHPSAPDVMFKAVLRGRPGCTYVIAADPASQIDNFAVVVLEVWPDHRRVVYCWTTRKSEYEAAKKRGLTAEGTFYKFCARKLRSLLRLFSPTTRLAIDTQGGGHQIVEALNDPDEMLPGEQFIYPWTDPDDHKPTDDLAGEHILDLVQFANAQWTSFANHGLKKDLEDKVVLFPFWDIVETAMALERDKEAGRVQVDPETGEALRLSDTLEDAVDNIEKLKDEMALIVHSQTPSGREQWDLPDRKGAQGDGERLRKDRYSALLMANAAARQLLLSPPRGPMQVPSVGGVVHAASRGQRGPSVGPNVPNGPDWFVRGMGGFTGGAVTRGSNQ